MKHKIITSLLLAFALCTTSLVFGQNAQTFNDDRPKAGDLQIAEEVTISKFTEDWQLTCNEIKTSGSLGSSKLTPVFKAIYSVISDLNTSLDRIKKLNYSLDAIEFSKAIKALLKLDQSDNLALGSSFFSKKIEDIQNQLEDIHEPKDHLSDQANNEIFKTIASRTSLELDQIDNQIDSILTKLIEKQEKDSLQKAYTAIKKAIKEIEKAEKQLNSRPFKQKALRAKAKELHYKYNWHSSISAKKQYITKLLKQAREHVINNTEERIKILENSLNLIQKGASDLEQTNQQIDTRKKEYTEKKKKIEQLLATLKELKNKKIDLENRKQSTNRNTAEEYKKLEKSISDLKDSIQPYKSSLDQLVSAKKMVYYADSIINLADTIPLFKQKNRIILKLTNSLSFLSTEEKENIKMVFSSEDSFILNKQNINTCIVYFYSLDSTLRKKTKAKSDSLSQQTLALDRIKSLNEQIALVIKEIDALENKLRKIDNCANTDNSCLESVKKELKSLDASLKQNLVDLNKVNSKKKELEEKISLLKAIPKYQQTLVIKSVQVEFYEGFIENIWVFGYLKNNPQRSLKFENRAPIRFSSKTAYNKRNNVYLAAAENEDVYWVLYMGDLISYLQNHESGTKDYSPANGSVTWTNLKEVKSLYKKATSKVFEAHVFSDFVGFDEAAPNGLIQMELSKRFNIYTRKFGSFLSKNAVYCKCQGPIYSSNWGFLNFIRPSFIYSKFEEKQRNLQLGVQNKIINGQLQSIKFASTNYILQHEMFNVGATVNAVTLDIPLAKSIAFLNLGFAYGRTELADSIYQYKDKIIRATDVKYYGLNTIRLFAEIVYKITPEKRYGIETSIRAIWLKALTDQSSPFFQVNEANQITSRTNTNHQWMLRFEISGFFRPSKDSDNKLFLRYRLHGQFENLNYNFHQLQVGYSFYLLRSNIIKTNGPTASK